MKKILILLSAFSLAAYGENAAPAPAPAPASPPAATEHAPQIVCEQSVYEFGEADPATPVEHAFTIANKGDLTLEIKQVRPSCGCTVAEISQRTLKPGETASLTAKLNLQGRSGPQEKHILVESNDPRTPNLMLSIKGSVKQDFLLAPDRLTPGQLRGDQAVSLDIVFNNNTPQTVKVTRVETSVSGLVATVSAVTEGKTYRIGVQTVPPLASGPFDGNIRIFTDSPARPVFDVPFSAVVMGAIVVAPPQLLLTQGGDPVTRYIILRPGVTQAFKVLNVIPPDPAIKWEQTGFGANGVRIQLSNMTGKPEINGKPVRILTDVETMREIDVPVMVVSPTG
jgi:hypothetical protein